jgi:hypothetical protein
MEIIGRNPTPDPYSIKDIKVSCELAENRVRLYLIVSLEPEFYSRNRYGNDSFEKKQNPCQLRIHLSEFHTIDDALRRELKDSYQFMADNNRDLLQEFINQKYQPKEETKKAG